MKSKVTKLFSYPFSTSAHYIGPIDVVFFCFHGRRTCIVIVVVSRL